MTRSTNFGSTVSRSADLVRIGFLILVALVSLLSACDSKENENAVTQVAARVNGEEITIHQVNNVLSRTVVPAQAASQAKREILERLINQELAKQQALEKKLDRTPGVVQAIEAAKNEILARAYLEQLAAAQPKPTAEDVKTYYANNPALFSDRRLYHIEEIVVRSNPELGRDLREEAAKSRSIQALAAWLKSRNAQFAQSERIVASEEVPFGVLPTLRKTRQGEIQVNEAADRISVFRIVSARSAPLDEAQAAPRIQQFLARQRANEAVASEIKRLRSVSKVEYRGEFATETAPAATASPEAASAATNPEAASKSTDFDKGLRGLK